MIHLCLSFILKEGKDKVSPLLHTLLMSVIIHINTKFVSFYNTIKNIFQCLIFCTFNFLFYPFSFKLAISLTFVLYTFVVLYPYRKSRRLAARSSYY